MQLKKLEKESKKESMTQIFMEAPFRSKILLERILKTLQDETRFCVAWDLTMQTQGVVTQKIGVWKKVALPNIEKKPAIFLIDAS